MSKVPDEAYEHVFTFARSLRRDVKALQRWNRRDLIVPFVRVVPLEGGGHHAEASLQWPIQTFHESTVDEGAKIIARAYQAFHDESLFVIFITGDTKRFGHFTTLPQEIIDTKCPPLVLPRQMRRLLCNQCGVIRPRYQMRVCKDCRLTWHCSFKCEMRGHQTLCHTLRTLRKM